MAPDGLPPGPVVKICGLTRLEDILAARTLGAWALGFVFAPSPRRLTPAEARGLIDGVAAVRPRGVPPARPAGAGAASESGAQSVPAVGWGSGGPPAPLAVGVFGDVTAEEVARIVRHVGLDAVQLHGRSGPAAAEVREALAGWTCPRALGGALTASGAALLIIQAVPVAPTGASREDLRAAIVAAGAEADLVLLDTRATGLLGGTGTTFPWRLAREAAGGAPFLVAGGIDPENVQAALEESAAWGVDVSSGVESSPGSKDVGLMGRLLARVEAVHDATVGGTSMDERQEGPRT
jgi:phosphoribosylanthranilate isomerase